MKLKHYLIILLVKCVITYLPVLYTLSYFVDRTTCDRLTLQELAFESRLDHYMLSDKAQDRAEADLEHIREAKEQACSEYWNEYSIIDKLGIFDR